MKILIGQCDFSNSENPKLVIKQKKQNYSIWATLYNWTPADRTETAFSLNNRHGRARIRLFDTTLVPLSVSKIIEFNLCQLGLFQKLA